MEHTVDLSGLEAEATAGEAEIAAGMYADIGDVRYSCPAGGEDCEVVVAADGTATSTGGKATAANSPAYEMKETAATTKAAGTKATAIATEHMQGTDDDAGLGGTARTDADGTTTPNDATDDVYGLVISRDGDGTEIKITDPAMVGDDDPKFTQAMDLDLGDGLTKHVRKQKADADGNVEEEVVMVRTDIEAPTPVAFAKFKDAAGTETQTLNARQDGVTVSDDNVADSILVPGTDTVNLNPANATEAANILTLVKAAQFTAAGALELPFDADTAGTADKNEAAKVPGTYNGASGTYTCSNTTGTSCTVTRTVAEGKYTISAMAGGWTFKPDAGAMSDQSDYDYVHYGFWLKRTTDAMGAVTYNEVETFADASRAESSDVGAVEGTATYTGGATGVYVKNTLDENEGTIKKATAGHFTADVELTATFGQEGEDPKVAVNPTENPGRIAPNKLNTIVGTINEFLLSGGEKNSWSVTIEGDISTTDGTASGTAKGNVKNEDGSFSATFHGTPTTTTTAETRPHTKPSAVVGEFNSFFTNGSVAGAFGAQEKKE